MWVGCHLSKAGRGGMLCLDGGGGPQTSVGGRDLSHGGGCFGSLHMLEFCAS